MTTSRRLTALPLPAGLLRTIQRLTSSRFPPSGKSHPSSPLVLTTSRRLAPLPLLLIALLALGGVLLWSTPAEAQTAGTLVSNLSQGNDDDAALSGNDHAQLFHTAANTGSNTGGWVLTSVIVDSEDPEDDDFNVKVCLADDTTGFPTSDCTNLKPPGDFTAGQLEFKAFFTGMLLNANDNYTVVISQDGTGNVTLDSTTSGGEDSGSVADWSIKGKFDWNNGGTWQQKAGANEALRIKINGYERPGNRQPTGLPRVLPTGEDQGILYADTSRIADADGFVNIGAVESTGIHHEFDYQWIRVDGTTETNIADATSARYRRVEDDIGKHIKVEVSYTDRFGSAESVTSLPFGPVPAPAPSRPATTLVGNTGQSPASAASITSAYEMGFKLGTHGQGYEISSVSIDLDAAPASLTVSLYAGPGPGRVDIPGARTKLFDFENPDSFVVGLNEFTAPTGAFAYQNAQYFIRLSGFGTTLSINETTSDDEDAGGEPGATLADEAGGDTNVLRLAVKGSKRTSGIIASTYTQITGDQEIVSVGDLIGNEVFFGPEADRYLIRGLSFTMDDTTPSNGGFTNPWRMRSGSTTLFRMVSSRQVSGINEFTAPVGSTVAGRAGKYNLYVDIQNFDRMGAVVLSRYACTTSTVTDAPRVPGVRFGEDIEDFACPTPIMAIFGEPLHAMTSNLGQTDNSYASATATNAVLSQGFTTGPNAAGYRLQGIGVNIEGSGSNFPDGPTSVSVAVHADSGGKPGLKLFDLVSPSEYAAGHSFFEAPPGTTLAADTSYVLVWSHLGGAEHRLHRTLSDNEDAGALAGFSIANVFYRGADVDNLTANSTSNVLEIAVYTNRDLSPPKRVTGFDLVSNNSTPKGIWGNDDTFWVANDGSGATNKLYAYKRSDGSRDSSSDFDNLDTAGNDSPSGICSDGATMFVADRVQLKIYAYKMSDTTRVTGKEFSLDSDNSSPQGLSCDGTHIWVADQTNSHTTSKIFVYEKDGTHASSLDLPAGTLSPSNNDGTVNNHDQRGMWSNGTTLFVVDQNDSQVYAYTLSDRSRDDDKNLSLDAANTDPWGLWFDGRVLWVVDDVDDKLYVYDLPGAQPGNTAADGVPEVRTPSEQVWATTLTAGTNPALGFGYITLLAPSVGSLSTTTFTLDSDTYTIKDLYDGNLGALVFILDKEMPVPFTLSVAGQDFRSISSVNVASGTDHIYSWIDANLSWSANDTISVVLNVDAAPRDGVELTADTSRVTDDTDGLDNVFYHYQWIRVDGTTVTELDGETGPTYTATADDVTKDIQVRVIFDDDVRNREYPRYSPQVTVREVPPEVTGVTLTSNPGSDEFYGLPDPVTATVTFDKAVDITAGAQITLLFGTAEKAADCAAAANTTTMACSYTVAANDTAPDGVGIKANTLTLNGGTIYATGSTTNAATLTHSALSLQSGHKVDGIRPTLVTTSPNAPTTSTDGTQVILTFNEDLGSVDQTLITIQEGSTTLTTTAASLDASDSSKVVITLMTALTTSATNLTVTLNPGAVFDDTAGNANLAQSAVTILNNIDAAPSAPTGLTAEPAPDETPQLAVDLSWTAPTSDGGSAITSHQYRYNRNSGAFGSWTTIGNSGANGANATSFTVTGLSAVNNALTTFEFEVRAINANGNGAESDPAATATIDKPDAITTLTPTIGNGQVEFTWSTPANNGSAILRYEYNVVDLNSITVVPTTNIAATATSLTITGLTNGDAYSLGIRAVNTVGGATWASYGFTPMAGPPGKPSVTVQSRVAALYVSWTLEDDGGSNITEYEVQWKSGAQSFDSSRQQAGLTATNTRIENLINGTEYDVRVRAMNSAGWGEWSDIVPGTPVEGPAVSFSTVTLSIDEGGSGTYSVVLTTEPTSPVTILVSRGGDVTTEPNTLRFTASNWNIWQSVTVNAGQDGDADDDTVAITHTVHPGSAAEYVALTDVAIVQVTVLDDDEPPPPVRGFSAADESQDAVALSWWSERGAAEYQLEYRKQGDTGNWTRVTRGDFDHLPSTSGNRSLTAIATGLECNTTYDFRIRLRGSGDILLNIFGPHTEISHKTGQCAQPDRPTNLMYTLAPDCATLTWTAPTGGDYTGVRIRRLTRGDDNYTVIHERLNSRPTSYRDCTNTGDGYGDGDNPWYAYRVTYVKFESGLLVESKHAKSGLHQYGPAFQDHLHATPRNVRLTRDTDSQRRMSWDAPPSWSLTAWAGLQGASVPVRDPWITGYVVERREFRARADGYLYFPDEDEDLPVWNATMTVGESSDDQRVGYSSESNNHFGSLSQDTFNHVAGRYRVLGVWYRPSRLQLSLGGTPPPHAAEDWDLVINGDRFPLADALIDPNGFTLISWTTSSLSWANGQQVSVQLVDRDRYGWKTVREGDTSTSFTDNEQANGRKFVYRIRSTNKYGVSTTHSIFDWLWDSPHRDAVIDLAATDTTTDDSSSGSTGDGRTNNAATGAPTISGTPQVGGTLTASTSPIDDQDGLTNVSYRYQWVAGGSDIDGATGSTYTLTYSEQGQTIQVRVTFTDDRNNAETLTSIATAAVAAAPAPLTATLPVSPYQSARHKGADDRPQVIVAFSRPVASFEKTTLSVSLTGAAVSSVRQHQEDGLENAWIFFLNPDDNDDIVFSLATGQPCDSGGICTDDGRRLSSAVQTTLPGPDEEGEPDNPEPDDPNNPATGAPTISGTPQVEQTLTANTSAIQDADGLQNVNYQYQWLAAGSAISGATGSSYQFTSTEEGNTIQVRVSFNDDKGNAESLTSVATDPVAAKPAPLTASFSNVPDSHDGSTEFTFDLTFSENFELSYKTLRDHAFTKDAQNEDHIVAARRKVPGSNQTWTITVEPSGNRAITIKLPETTDCSADGAICTSDGRMLLNSTTVSISGPS